MNAPVRTDTPPDHRCDAQPDPEPPVPSLAEPDPGVFRHVPPAVPAGTAAAAAKETKA